jgi:hypothetical protein
VELRVEAGAPAAPQADVSRAGAPHTGFPHTGIEDAQLENPRSHYAVLEAEVDRLRRELAAARNTAEQDERVARLEGENDGLRKRLESLRTEVEEREVEDGASVQARLAMQRVEAIQELNEKLQRDMDRLKAERRTPPSVKQAPAEAETAGTPKDGPSPELEQARAEVQRLTRLVESERVEARVRGDQTEVVRKLRAELEALRMARKADPESTGTLQECRKELQEAREHAAELEGRLAGAGPSKEQNVSDLFFKLQSENVELRRKLAGLERPAVAEARPPGDNRHVRELMEARLRITALEGEISNLRIARAATPPPQAAPKGTPGPVGSRKAVQAAAAEGGASESARRILSTLVEKDVEGLLRPSGGPAEEFVLIESVRLLRQVERVVTRVAGDLIQLFLLKTMLPDTVGSYRDIVGKLLEAPGDAAERDRLVEYLETLGRWLVASIGAHRKAAVLFASKLKEELSEKSLTAKDPLPSYARVPMIAGGELWRRAQQYLSTLSPDSIDERIDALAREQARLILNDAP